MRGGDLNYFLHILSSLVNVRLHTENWLCNLPGSALKVSVGGGGGWVFESELSDQLWLSFSLALAKRNNYHCQSLSASHCYQLEKILTVYSYQILT